ncbi:acyl-CoA dehydrogenase family protein [Rhodococcus rhodochrous]|uniref:Acyl-CoA dehydrogenase n=1 Tax=Rhodococcus rhodochrous KG-21 TaxID=1441923 RepID=A0A0N0S0Y9_RHORH|nr:acyl-CoA dehydrogenase family protein [Rhodococcus rhodochrous]KOS56701.1 acyl-CoA dehydrogenase [Rhodococcus rhodochrous KG-21]
MTLTFTPEREELRTVVRKFFATHSSEAQVRTQMEAASGFDSALWKLMAEQIGVQSLAIPEEYGGAGFGFAELAVVLEEAGRVLLCAPLFSTTVLATNAILLSGDATAAETHLPGIAEGRTIASLAILEESDHWTEDGIVLRADREPGTTTYVLTGVKEFVLDGADADLLIVAARTETGVSLFTVDAHERGVETTALATLDQTRRQARIDFAGAPAQLLGSEGDGWRVLQGVLDIAAAALACEQVGGAAQVLEATVDYVKTRQQFGRQIGSFQAVKHKLADMLVELESARSAAYFACAAVESSSPEVPIAASIAKSYCSTAYYHIAAESIQLHGGIGFTWEHPAHLYFKRAKGSEALLGSPAYHRELIAQRLGI